MDLDVQQLAVMKTEIHIWMFFGGVEIEKKNKSCILFHQNNNDQKRRDWLTVP